MQFIRKKSAFENNHFDPRSVIILPHAINIPAVLGLSLTRLEIAQLSGAPKNSSVKILVKRSWTPEEDDGDNVPPGLFFEITNPTYIRSANMIGIYKRTPATYGIYLKLVDFVPGKFPGLGARMIAVMVRAAIKRPEITHLRLMAAGGRNWDDIRGRAGERWGGYMAWPMYGFDMDLDQDDIDLYKFFNYYPKALAGCKKVSEILELEGGKEYWKIVGDGNNMDFELSNISSKSMLILDNYLGKKGL